MIRSARAALAVVLLSASCGAPLQAQVYLRGQRDPLVGTIESVGSEGIQLRQPSTSPTNQSAGGQLRIVGWDRVRTVQGEWADKAAPFLPIADLAWRARARVERSDLLEAEPLLEELFTTYRTLTGPTAAAIDEGLLRCRLARSSESAIWPWLAWTARLNEVGVPRSLKWVGGTIGKPPIRDETTGLIGRLYPMLVSDRATCSISDATDWEDWLKADRVTSQMAQLFRSAAAFECGGHEPAVTFPLSGKGQPDHPGVRLVNEIVVSRLGDSDQRRIARGLLEQRIRSTLANQVAVESSGAPADPDWLEPWCRAALGRSLLREEDEKERRRGVMELLHVPARFVDTVPALAAQSLAEAAIAMQQMGDAKSAAILCAEFSARFPDHPLREWPPFRDVSADQPLPQSPASTPAPPSAFSANRQRHASTR